MNSILLVCEGNICRSPMAAGILAAALPDKRVTSAGTHALIGMPADDIALQLMQERGIDIGGHRAIQITRSLCLESDMVLVMDTHQRRYLEEAYPQACGRVFRLGEVGNVDVPDPYRRGEAAFRDSLERIEQGVREWLRRLQRI